MAAWIGTGAVTGIGVPDLRDFLSPEAGVMKAQHQHVEILPQAMIERRVGSSHRKMDAAIMLGELNANSPAHAVTRLNREIPQRLTGRRRRAVSEGIDFVPAPVRDLARVFRTARVSGGRERGSLRSGHWERRTIHWDGLPWARLLFMPGRGSRPRAIPAGLLAGISFRSGVRLRRTWIFQCFGILRILGADVFYRWDGRRFLFQFRARRSRMRFHFGIRWRRWGHFLLAQGFDRLDAQREDFLARRSVLRRRQGLTGQGSGLGWRRLLARRRALVRGRWRRAARDRIEAEKAGGFECGKQRSRQRKGHRLRIRRGAGRFRIVWRFAGPLGQRRPIDQEFEAAGVRDARRLARGVRQGRNQSVRGKWVGESEIHAG